VWKDAALPAPEDALVADIRSGKITSLKQQYGACYMNGVTPVSLRSKELIYAAITGRNVALLKEIQVNGKFNVARPMWDFDAVAVARDLMDRDVIAVLAAAAEHENVTFELLKAVRLDDAAKVKSTLDAGANPDGFAPLSETHTCNTSPLSYAKAKEIRTLLLERGAHINIVNGKGQTPVDLAVAAKDKSLARFLGGQGGTPGSQLPR
jgi:hypothetical protein